MVNMFICLLGVAIFLALVFTGVHLRRYRFYFDPLTEDEAIVLLVTVVNQLIDQPDYKNKKLVVDTYTKRLIILMGKKNKVGQEALQECYDKQILKLEQE